jgi:hypothetical protein
MVRIDAGSRTVLGSKPVVAEMSNLMAGIILLNIIVLVLMEQQKEQPVNSDLVGTARLTIQQKVEIQAQHESLPRLSTIP